MLTTICCWSKTGLAVDGRLHLDDVFRLVKVIEAIVNGSKYIDDADARDRLCLPENDVLVDMTGGDCITLFTISTWAETNNALTSYFVNKNDTISSTTTDVINDETQDVNKNEGLAISREFDCFDPTYDPCTMLVKSIEKKQGLCG